MLTLARTRPAVLVVSMALAVAASLSVTTPAQSAISAGAVPVGGYVESARWFTGDRSHAVAVGADSVVSVTHGDKIDRFDAAGRLVASLPLGFSSAYGMDVDPAGQLHVTEYGGSPSLVHVLTAAGVEVGAYAPPEGTSSNFNPIGIEVLPDGTRFVVDATGDAVHRFLADGAWGGRLGETGTGPGQFDSPADAAYSADGSLFVLDADNYRVQRFVAATGAFLGMWGQTGYDPGQFLSPIGVEVRPDGHVLVLDGVGSQQARLDEFLPDGTFVSRTELPLTYAGGLAVDGTGTVYVAGLMDYPQGGWGVLKLAPATGPTLPQRLSSAKVRGKRLDAVGSRKQARLRVACSAAATACTGKVQVRVGKRKVGRGSYSAPAGRADTVKVRFGSRARRLLKHHATVRVTVRLVPTEGAGSTRKMKLTR